MISTTTFSCVDANELVTRRGEQKHSVMQMIKDKKNSRRQGGDEMKTKSLSSSVAAATVAHGREVVFPLERHAEASTCNDDELFASYSYPDWVLYENEWKDWSSYYTCGDGYCDYTKLAEAARGVCYFYDKVLYKVNVTVTCPDNNQGAIKDINLPVCVSADCSIDDNFVLQNDMGSFDLCNGGTEKPTLDEFTMTQQLVPSPVSEECLEEMGSFTEAAGGGDPDFIYDDEDYDSYCDSLKNGVQTCDFMPIAQSLKASCEEEGGNMYIFTEVLSYSEGYYDYYGDEVSELVFKNLPVCLGSSCSAKAYFEDIVLPYNEWHFEGGWFEGKDSISYESFYDILEYDESSAQMLFPPGAVVICINAVIVLFTSYIL